MIFPLTTVSPTAQRSLRIAHVRCLLIALPKAPFPMRCRSALPSHGLGLRVRLSSCVLAHSCLTEFTRQGRIEPQPRYHARCVCCSKLKALVAAFLFSSTVPVDPLRIPHLPLADFTQDHTLTPSATFSGVARISIQHRADVHMTRLILAAPEHIQSAVNP